MHLDFILMQIINHFNEMCALGAAAILLVIQVYTWMMS